MKITRLTPAEGASVASRLIQPVPLDGTYNLSPRPDHPTRYMLTPAIDDTGEFRVVIGRDPKIGRLTLLQNHTEAVILFDAIPEPARTKPR